MEVKFTSDLETTVTVASSLCTRVGSDDHRRQNMPNNDGVRHRSSESSILCSFMSCSPLWILLPAQVTSIERFPLHWLVLLCCKATNSTTAAPPSFNADALFERFQGHFPMKRMGDECDGDLTALIVINDIPIEYN